ncbi:hypothetical protein JCM8547_004407 [Rhodosporidiobolus lusitaniae]
MSRLPPSHRQTPSFGSTSDTPFDPSLPPPSRPERSARRPQGSSGMSPSPAGIMTGNESGRFEGGVPPRIGVTDTGAGGMGTGQGKNARMLDGLRGGGGGSPSGNGGPPSPSLSPNLALSSSPSKHGGSNNPFARSSPLQQSHAFPSHRPGPRDDDYSSSSSSSSRAASPVPGSNPDGEEGLVVPTALSDAIQAFSHAGARRADGRRGGLADQGFDVPSSRRGPGASASPNLTGSPDVDRSPNPDEGGKGGREKKARLDPNDYPDTAAFREVDDALRRVRDEWPSLVRGTSLAGQLEGEEDEGAGFDPVSLALHLLDPSRSGEGGGGGSGARQTLPSFLRLKQKLDAAIRSTLSPSLNPSSSSNPYRAYETAITSHNLTLQSLSGAQKHIAGLRTGLGGTRERLEGKGREGLAGMYSRMGMLEEMGGVLDEIDSLLRLPPSLESLLSEKRFLSAVVLLVRSIKTLNKPEMMEIGALADLRSWAGAQEGVVLEILIEELHNHLYLKSFYCDVRWKSYTRGQTALPLVDFGDDLDPSLPLPSSSALTQATSFHSSGRSTARLPRLSKLQRFLQNLALKPTGMDPAMEEDVGELLSEGAEGGEEGDELGLGTGSIAFGTGETLASALSSAGDASSMSGEKKRTRKEKAAARRNPEVDSFAYVEMLLEALAALGKLGYALDAVGQRVQGEMFALVEGTVEEVEERNDMTKQFASTTSSSTTRPSSFFSPPSPNPNPSSSLPFSTSSSSAHSHSWATDGVASLLRLSASETSTLASSVETLRDLFWTLYSKLDAVLQGFRVAYEVAGRIAERRDFKDATLVKTSSGNLLFSLLDVWKPVQQEVRALLHDYLTDDESGTVSSRNPIVSVNEVLRFPGRPRDGAKHIFKFGDSDLQASSKLLRPFEDSLNAAIKSAVPGLITDGLPSTTTTSALIVASTDPSSSSSGSRSSGLNGTHKALVPADAFNVSVLFGPTLAFLERVKEIMPGGLIGEDETNASTGFGGFIEEFVARTFLPQLEEKVASVFHQAVGGIDAFQEDPNYKRVSRVPIVRSVTNLMLLISSLCSMLRATPFHRENYSQLIVSVIHQFYQKCLERFKDLTARDTNDNAPSNNASGQPAATATPKMAASMAENHDLHALLSEMRAVPPTDPQKLRDLLQRETKLELDRKRNGVVAGEDLISPSKKMWALATLYSSLDWFIQHVSSLKTSTDGSSSAFPNGLSSAFGGRRGPRESGYSTTSTTVSADGSPALGSARDEDEDGESGREEGFALPLTSDMTRPFEALLKAYRHLASLVLFTLRLEIRLRAMHYLDKATRDGVYQLAEDIQEPDPSVVDLNSNLAECDEVAAGTLAEGERKFIFDGLSLLMDELLIHNARHIRLANKFGQAKMLRNILALQQNLKNLGDSPLDVDFDRSRRFWDLFAAGPKDMLDLVRKGEVQYDFDDLKALLNLQCGVDQSGKDGSAPNGADGAVPLSAGGMDRNRRQYNEYLIELFSLDPTGGMAED